jgi:hypothetical protein
MYSSPFRIAAESQCLGKKEKQAMEEEAPAPTQVDQAMSIYTVRTVSKPGSHSRRKESCSGGKKVVSEWPQCNTLKRQNRLRWRRAA